MYEASAPGPGGFVVSRRATDRRLSLTTRLRKAVDERHWVLHYQPIIDLADGHVHSVEALIRWQEPNGGLVAPGEFIPLAEELGLIEAIGEWVLDECSAASRVARGLTVRSATTCRGSSGPRTCRPGDRQLRTATWTPSSPWRSRSPPG
jgi:predicted signal transduction protein with EAL and GGDEF domain